MKARLQQREAARGEQCRGDALQDARGDEQFDRRRHRDEDRRNGERRCAPGEHAFAAEPVTERTAHHDEGRERKGVAVDDPLQARDVGPQFAADAGQGHIGDGAVEEHQTGAGDRGGEQAPSGGIGQSKQLWLHG